MAYTAEQLAALEMAISLGARSVQYDGKLTTYRTLAEMRSLRDEMRRELGLVGQGPVRRVIASNKGLGGSSAASRSPWDGS